MTGADTGKRRYRTRLALVGLCAAAMLASGCAQVPLTGQWDYGIHRFSLHGKKRIGQDFLVSDHNLTRVDIFLYPSKILEGKKSKKARRMAFRELKGRDIVVRLFSLPDRKRLATFKLPVRQVRDERMYKFVFEPITDSKRRRYYFELSAPKLTAARRVSVRLTNKDRYKRGKAYLNGQPERESDLAFRSYIDMSMSQLFHSIGSRLTKDMTFLVLWSGLMLGILIAAADAWRRALSRTETGKP